MSEFELNILLIEYASGIDAQFNFWMAMTFAIVIASHTAGDLFNRLGRSALVFLYLLTCAVIYVRYLAGAAQVTIVIPQLRELVGEVGFAKLGQYTGIGRRVLMLGGTVFAVLVVVRPTFLKHKNSSSE